jgi:hypothetical protein
MQIPLISAKLGKSHLPLAFKMKIKVSAQPSPNQTITQLLCNTSKASNYINLKLVLVCALFQN